MGSPWVKYINVYCFAFHYYFVSYSEYTKRMSETYDSDTTRLFDEDPDLVRLRRHVADNDSKEEFGSPVGARISAMYFEGTLKGSGLGTATAETTRFNDDEFSIPQLHCRGFVQINQLQLLKL